MTLPASPTPRGALWPNVSFDVHFAESEDGRTDWNTDATTCDEACAWADAWIKAHPDGHADVYMCRDYDEKGDAVFLYSAKGAATGRHYGITEMEGGAS